MLVQKMSIQGHGDSDSSEISTPTRLPEGALPDPAMDLELMLHDTAERQLGSLYVCVAKEI